MERSGPSAEPERTAIAWLGVELQNLDDMDLASYFGVDLFGGVLITRIAEEGPADDAGLRRRDIILALEGEAVHRRKDVGRRVRIHSAGDSIQITLLRNGERLDLSATLGSRPSDYRAPSPPPAWKGNGGAPPPESGGERPRVNRHLNRLREKIRDLREKLKRLGDKT